MASIQNVHVHVYIILYTCTSPTPATVGFTTLTATVAEGNPTAAVALNVSAPPSAPFEVELAISTSILGMYVCVQFTCHLYVHVHVYSVTSLIRTP